MNIVGRQLSLTEFEQYVSNFNFGKIPPTMLVVHHTWKPTKQDWKGAASINGLRRYYEGLGWPAAPHLFVAEDGIWLFTPMSEVGIHAGEGNATWKTALGKTVNQYQRPWKGTLISYSVGIEVVGDYDGEKWTGETLKNAVGAIKILKNKLNISTEDIRFHRDFNKGKSCPGWAITKEWLGQQLLETKPECLKCPVHCK